ncbi:MAG: MarR family transcriptional regulator [Sciscionella sp.]|nr:MarR family transcriptional regulator [Sciscionella sp.]
MYPLVKRAHVLGVAVASRKRADSLMWGGVLALHTRIEQELAKRLQREHGLGLSDYRALSMLAAAKDGELRMQNLAESIGLNQSSVTRLVARLEHAGLTRRDICANDRRGIYSVITERGRERQAAAEPSYLAALGATLDAAADDDELAGLVRKLRS